MRGCECLRHMTQGGLIRRDPDTQPRLCRNLSAPQGTTAPAALVFARVPLLPAPLPRRSRCRSFSGFAAGGIALPRTPSRAPSAQQNVCETQRGRRKKTQTTTGCRQRMQQPAQNRNAVPARRAGVGRPSAATIQGLFGCTVPRGAIVRQRRSRQEEMLCQLSPALPGCPLYAFQSSVKITGINR